MSKIDKFLGLVMAAFLPFLLVGPVHWSGILLFTLAASIYLLFVFRPKRSRCVGCGHFYHRNLMQHITKQFRRKCEDCVHLHESEIDCNMRSSH